MAAALEQRKAFVALQTHVWTIVTGPKGQDLLTLVGISPSDAAPGGTWNRQAFFGLLDTSGQFNASSVHQMREVLEALSDPPVSPAVLAAFRSYEANYGGGGGGGRQARAPASSGSQPAEVGPVTDAERERRLLRLHEAWIAHYQVAGRLPELGIKWNSYSQQQDPLPDFGLGLDGAQRAHQHFIARRTLLKHLFSLLARFEQLRPDGLSRAEAEQLG